MPDTLLGTMSQQTIPMRVLVIDDDPAICELLSALLESTGYAVQSAASGEAALTLLCRPDLAFDLVLTDVQMPGITAAELAHRLRLACGPATLLLAMSGSQPPSHMISLFDGFLLKPFKINQVISALRMWKDPRRDPEHASPTAAPIAMGEPYSAESRGSATPGPVLHETIYRQLASTIPTPQLQEMYALCVNDARKRIATMRTLVAAHDAEQFVREAHSIKGCCGMLGATELHRMAAELERNGLQSSSTGKARDVYCLEELSAACDRLERMLSLRV